MKKVFCWGTFDVIHEGHIEFLKDAKSQGNHLTVIVIPDKAVLDNKNKLPKNTQKERVDELKNTGIPDEVVPVDNLDETFETVISSKPHIFVSGYDQSKEFIEKLKNHLSSKLDMDYYTSKEFANGIHASDILK